MTKLEELAQYDYSRGLTEYFAVMCLEDTDEETRHQIRDAVIKRMNEATTDFERGMITLAKARLDSFSYEEIVDYFALTDERDYVEHKTYGLDTLLRFRALSSKPGDEIALEEEGKESLYEVHLIFHYKDGMFILLEDIDETKESVIPKYYFYKFIFGEGNDLDKDRVVRVEDDALLGELCEEAKRLMDLSDKGIDEEESC